MINNYTTLAQKDSLLKYVGSSGSWKNERQYADISVTVFHVRSGERNQSFQGWLICQLLVSGYLNLLSTPQEWTALDYIMSGLAADLRRDGGSYLNASQHNVCILTSLITWILILSSWPKPLVHKWSLRRFWEQHWFKLKAFSIRNLLAMYPQILLMLIQSTPTFSLWDNMRQHFLKYLMWSQISSVDGVGTMPRYCLITSGNTNRNLTYHYFKHGTNGKGTNQICSWTPLWWLLTPNYQEPCGL